MIDWTLFGEFYSLFLLFILFLRHYEDERNVAPMQRRQIFTRSLLLAICTTLLNICRGMALRHTDIVPIWVCIAICTLYFFVYFCMFSLFLLQLFDASFEHIYEKHRMKTIRVMLTVSVVIAAIMLVVNLFTGFLFYFSETGNYHSGSYRFIFFIAPTLELVFLLFSLLRYWESGGPRMVYVMRTIPMLIVLAILLRLSFPGVSLTGILSSSICLIIFFAFRTYSNEWDSLTASFSRKAFIAELFHRIKKKSPTQFIQVTLLSLSDINLKHTSAVGDALLYEVAHFLQRAVPHSRLFRTASVTFTLVLPFENDKLAESRLDDISRRLHEEWVIGDKTLKIKCAIAEMSCTTLSGRPSQIVEQLEYTRALAKANHNVVRFDEEIHAQMARRSYLIELIRRSIKEDRFILHYQPIYCYNHHDFCSAEALLRLNDEDGTPIPPDVFIPLAEETGLVCDLTWVVLDKACQLLSSGKAGLKNISVNLSMQQLLDPQLAERIKEYLTRYKLEASQLKLEITERFVLHDENYAKRILEELAAIGVMIVMDDFGTGYSNLSSVLQYPFSQVKLDRSLIASLPDNKQSKLMAKTLLGLFHELGMSVVAEGVETAEQVEYLASHGIDMIQGYHYSRPLPEAELISFMDAHK